MKKLNPAVLVLLAAFLPSGTTASAAEPAVGIELNKLEPRESSCRAYLVVKNHTKEIFDELELDLVMFDTDGVVAKRLALGAGPLPADKTVLKVFDVTALRCERVGRVLLNGVIACADASGTRTDCLDAIATSTRADVPFIK